MGSRSIQLTTRIKFWLSRDFNHTLKNKMWKYFTAHSMTKHIDLVQNLVDQYNNSKPTDVDHKDADLRDIAQTNYHHYCQCQEQSSSLVIELGLASADIRCLKRGIHQTGPKRFLLSLMY